MSISISTLRIRYYILTHQMKQNCDLEWKSLMSKQIKKIDPSAKDDSDIEIVIEQKDPKQQSISMKKEDALAFWLKRVKHKQNVIDITDSQSTSSAINSAKLPSTNNKPALPIVTHQKERERANKEAVINVESESTKFNVQKYKQSIFRLQEQKPKYVEPQQSKKRRQQKQLSIIESMNVPRWIQQKQKRHETNKFKYPISNSFEYNFSNVTTTRSKVKDQFNEVTWARFQRQKELARQKKQQQREIQRQLEREKKKEEEKKRKLEQEAEYQQLLLMVDKQKKKQKPNEIDIEDFQDLSKTAKAEQQRMSIVQNINAEQGDIKQIQSSNEINGTDECVQWKMRVGVKDIIKPEYHSRAPNFINTILSHNYREQFNLPENKKIPDIFENQSVYRKVFHLLITNQCLADVSRRLKDLERNKNSTPIKIHINNYRNNTEGQTEIFMTEIGKQEEKFFLKNYSLSKYRLGLITSSCDYEKQFYGFNENSEHFAQLVMLVTPQTKEELQVVRAVGNFKIHDLDWMIKKRKSQDAFFYDLEKLSTHVREYIAVSNLSYCELAPVILDPRLLEKEMCPFIENKECLNDILGHLQRIFNPTQWESIRQMVLRERGIVLLQGPPGTGKTSTLMGLLSAQYEYLKKSGDNRKIMICAPSNAAVDHIVKRLQCQGLFNGQGDIIKPVILRAGIVQTMDPDVRAASLDDLCQKRLIQLEERAKEESKMTTPQIKERIIAIQKQMRKLSGPGQQKERAQKNQEIIRCQAMLYSFKSKKMVTSRKNYNQIQNEFLTRAEIVLTTLSSSGNEKLDRLRGQIACLIIDQAAQATQTNLLIALQSGVEKVLLIGDPYQLPATCISSDCNVTLFNRSLFQRFLDANIKPYFLNIQYRMAPLIRYFPSYRFYHDRLIDSDTVIKRELPDFLLCFHNKNVIFIDIKYGRDEKRGDSQINHAEGEAIGLLVKCLLDPNISMGVITPYQAQRKIIKNEAFRELKANAEEVQLFEKNIMINTVDSFQGQERDIILVSTVRANNRKQLGFLTDQRRINVTLTRSKYVLIIVGNGDTLGGNEVWNSFLEMAQEQKVYFEVHSRDQLKAQMKHVFESYNQKPIRRRKYDEFTSDIRKQHRQQIQSEDFKLKKNNDKVRFQQQGQRSSKGNQIVNKPSKYALDIKQSNQIIQEKRLKEKQTEQFQAMNQRLRIMQQKISKGGDDNFYKDLFG